MSFIINLSSKTSVKRYKYPSIGIKMVPYDIVHMIWSQIYGPYHIYHIFSFKKCSLAIAIFKKMRVEQNMQGAFI